MKLQLRDLVQGGEALTELAQLEIPLFTSYKIAKNLRLIAAETQPYFDARQKVFAPFVEEKTGLVRIPPQSIDEVNDKLNPLLDVEIELKIATILLKDLGEIEVKPAVLAGAWFMFEEK